MNKTSQNISLLSALLYFGFYRVNFQVGMVLKQKGIYEISFIDNREVTACSGPYLEVGFPPSLISYRLNVVDGNKDVYLSIPANSRGESIKHFTEDAIDNKEIFIVKVE